MGARNECNTFHCIFNSSTSLVKWNYNVFIDAKDTHNRTFKSVSKASSFNENYTKGTLKVLSSHVTSDNFLSYRGNFNIIPSY